MPLKDILRILEADARTDAKQIAAQTGRSEEEVRDAIRQAERNGTILKYKTVVDWEKAGEEEVWALIEVNVSPQRDVGFDAVAERIYRFREARSVYLVSGTYDLAVLVVGRNMQEVASFVAQRLAPLESVQGTVTHFLLKRYKEDGVILGETDKVERLAISP